MASLQVITPMEWIIPAMLLITMWADSIQPRIIVLLFAPLMTAPRVSFLMKFVLVEEEAVKFWVPPP